MSEAEAIFSSIQFDPGLEEQQFKVRSYNRMLGFAWVDASIIDDEPLTGFIGFTGQRQKSISVGQGDIRSVTRLEQLQDDERTIKMQARGVGTRMYNTPEALLGTGEGENIHAYTFAINPARIVDRRRVSDRTRFGRIRQAARQAGKILQAQVMGLEATVDGIHESFDYPVEADAVLYNQSATMEIQQRQLGGVEQPAGIPPEFMVIRNPHIIMHRIGSYRG